MEQMNDDYRAHSSANGEGGRLIALADLLDMETSPAAGDRAQDGLQMVSAVMPPVVLGPRRSMEPSIIPATGRPWETTSGEPVTPRRAGHGPRRSGSSPQRVTGTGL